MPNGCLNYMMFTGSEKDVSDFVSAELDIPERKYTVVGRGLEAIRIKLWLPWKPDFEWMESLLTKYPSCWIKNEWIVEDGEAGTWIGTARDGEKMIKRMMWDDMSLEEAAHRFRVN